MNFSIVFDNTGDSIPFKTTNHNTADLLCYYHENLIKLDANQFVAQDDIGSDIQKKINSLHLTLKECNTWIYEIFDRYFDIYNTKGYLDQQNLNKLHSDWAKSSLEKYDIQSKRRKHNSTNTELIHDMFSDDIPVTVGGEVIRKLGFKQIHDKINLDIHSLEQFFDHLRFCVKGQRWIQFDNPFSKQLITNDISNFSLTFRHLGRLLFEKFMNFDMDLKYQDENSYDQLLGFVSIRLIQPQTIGLSNEYVAWCRMHNKIPSGTVLNIGNIPDLINKLTDYRSIVFQNTLQHNSFSIQLTKG